LSHIDPDLLLPLVKIQPLTYEQRLAAWNEGFGEKAADYSGILAETARRFRFERSTIAQICRELQALPKPPTEDDFIAACRAELNFDIGELAAFVEPRFIDEKLILPHKQDVQFEEQLAAMTSLTKVHYGWGTARAWNEGGITVLFAGPPGTGKTMAAEVMAYRLKLPMYRIDLSQVVNKYIGETEKNLKRIFDAADISDMVLFFDEADALFGKRTDVSDSRDRYANLEISYLLERMERFRGLAILATNRKNDLDQAFLRRIRHIIDFPVPDEEQRARMWKQMIPESVAENSRIDIPFLARQFPLSGGHIRSIVFNACLQSAHSANGGKELFMRDVLVAVKREYDKMNRSLSLDQLGPYGSHIAALE
jgi:SpoVK/Ycf46/Vps4 family AAA+-type ATPase